MILKNKENLIKKKQCKVYRKILTLIQYKIFLILLITWIINWKKIKKLEKKLVLNKISNLKKNNKIKVQSKKEIHEIALQNPNVLHSFHLQNKLNNPMA